MSMVNEWKHLEIPFDEIEVATENFKTFIGRGGYGSVFKGKLLVSGKETMVAVKRLNEQFGQGLKEFLTEIQLLSGQQHPNLISLVGFCDEGKEKSIVYEYAERGSLDQYIRRTRKTTSTTLTWLQRLKICTDAARGLDHLHRHVGGYRTIIHRDIKSSNILIDENWVAKISDLGLSKLSVTGFGMSVIISNGCGTQGYCEPEYYITGFVTKKSDVYSFGVVLFEVLCGRLCLIDSDDGFSLSGISAKEYYKNNTLDKIMDDSLREHMGSYSMTKFAAIAYRCLHDDRKQRPAMDVVVKELEEALKYQEEHEFGNEKKSKSIVEAKLPEDLDSLIKMFNIPHEVYTNIKELFSYLHEGINFDGGYKDLIDRIIAVLSDEQVSGMWSKKNAVGKEEVAKLVVDIYRKMQDSGATDLTSKSRGVADGNTMLKEEFEDINLAEKVRCPCGSLLQVDYMIKCEDPRCNAWQHILCVIIPEKPMEGILPAPPQIFYCQLCRLSRADPFWVTIALPVPPVKLIMANPPTDGTNPMLSLEKTFHVTRADMEIMLVKPEYDVQAWCMLLNDKVFFRMQWPQYAELQINGVPLCPINRPVSQLLGANGRDDGPIITRCIRDGMNIISLTGCDSRLFCLGVRIVKRRTVQQILNGIPKESDGERFEDALARVRRYVGGGAATENVDSDSDMEFVDENISVNLRCPISGSRMKIAGRFKPCAHMGCFDLEVLVEMNQRSRKWQCPICLKNYAWENIIIDPYFTPITSKMLDCGEDLTEIEVKPDGSWRAKPHGDWESLGDLGQWHLPDGTLCVPMEV